MGDEVHVAELAEVGAALEARGYCARPAPYFAQGGIFVFTPALTTRVELASSDSRQLEIIARTVLLYVVAGRFEARVTRHGGPHWIQSAASRAELEGLAVTALESTEIPPEGWVVAPDWCE
jgi:hypothetical protein